MTERYGSGAYGGNGFMPRWLPGPGFDMPGRIVEVAFGNNANDPIASMVWTDVTQWVRECETHRGKQHERNVVQAGTASFLLNNRDGRFSPWNTASPYYPNVEPMRPIRLRASWNGTTYPVWFGYVESWGNKWADPVNSDVEVQAVDGFQGLSLNSLVTNTYYADTMLADSPLAYWRLGEPPRTSVAADSSGNGHSANIMGGVQNGVAGAITSSSDTAMSFGDGLAFTSGMIDAGTGPARTGTAAMTWELWVKQPAVVAGPSYIVMSQAAPSLTPNLLLAVGGAGGTAEGKMFASLDVLFFGTAIIGTSRVDDGNWHHVVLTRSGSAWSLYVDGALEATATANPSYPAGSDVVLANGYSGALDEVAVYPVALSAAQVAAHHQAASGFVSQQSGARVNTVLDYSSWPTADRAIDVGASTLQAESRSLTSTAALEYLQQVERSEAGLLFVAPDGKLTFYGRNRALTNARSTTSQATFGGGPGELPYHLDGTDVGIDEADIYNEAVIGRIGGAPQVARDDASRAAYWPRTYTATDLLVATDGECWDRANWVLQRYKDPKVRVGAVSIDPRSDPANLFPVVLGLELWDRVTFKRATLDGGSTFQADQLIEGISHKITPSTWRTTFNLSPAEAQTSYWVVGVSRVGIDTRVGY